MLRLDGGLWLLRDRGYCHACNDGEKRTHHECKEDHRYCGQVDYIEDVVLASIDHVLDHREVDG